MHEARGYSSGMALEYDRCVGRSGYRVPEVLFGLMYEYVIVGGELLDIGTGTGRAARLFARAGMKVYGMDLSGEMLAVCRTKEIFTGLQEHNLTQEPYPYDSATMDMVICVGVLNHFADLDVFFKESTRILRPEGYLGIMTGYIRESELPLVERRVQHGRNRTHLHLLAHTDAEIEDYLSVNSLSETRSLVVRVCSSLNNDVYFPVRVSVLQKRCTAK